MLDGLTSRQIIRWIAFDAIEPFGEERHDYRSGILGSAVVNELKRVVASLGGKRGRPAKVDDFMPKFGEKKKATAKQLHAKMQQFAAMVAAYQKGKQ